MGKNEIKTAGAKNLFVWPKLKGSSIYVSAMWVCMEKNEKVNVFIETFLCVHAWNSQCRVFFRQWRSDHLSFLSHCRASGSTCNRKTTIWSDKSLYWPAAHLLNKRKKEIHQMLTKLKRSWKCKTVLKWQWSRKIVSSTPFRRESVTFEINS